MLKLSTIHIDEIRKFFLTSNEQEQLNIQKTIRPSYLSNFLAEIKSLFNRGVFNEPNLASIAKNMGAEEHIETLKEIQHDYYSYLAQLYIAGNSNADIKELLITPNSDFLHEVEFQKEIKTAFLLNEREYLKKKFQVLNRDSQLSTEEISEAFKILERRKLKQQFQNLDYESQEENIGIVAEASTAYSISNKVNSIKTETRIKSHWKRFAIAAIVIGLILTTSIIILNKPNMKKEVSAFNKSKIDHDSEPKNQYYFYVDEDISRLEYEKYYLNNFESEEKKIRVSQTQSYGFADQEENLITHVYYLQNKLDTLQNKLRDTTADSNEDSIILFTIRDSINSLANKYRFIGNTLSLYMFSKKKISVFKINSSYYMRIDNILYECFKSKKLLPFKVITNSEILEKIEKIIFDNTN